MSRETAIRIFCGMWGAAVGAAFSDVRWTWWASWACAWGAFLLIAYWHRDEEQARA